MSNTKKTAAGAVCSVAVIIGLVLGINSGIRTNQAGLELIGNAESCRRDPYMCPARVLTVGIGSTGKVQNRRHSDEEIAEMWITDIKIAEECVNNYANGQAMTDNQFSAVTSFTFNVGCGALKKSTLARHANRQQWPQMCGEFSKWVYIGKERSKGLENRRAKEIALWTKK